MNVYVFPVIMSLVAVYLSVITWQKIDWARGLETFFNFVWPYVRMLPMCK